ncbi:MAG: error-prone DNA polymerase [Chromatiales bacterium]|nr:error-prone DNA polymerase [Chromatiales bacterium]
MSTPAYAELHCLSNFSFLRGASHAQELVARAAELGYAALALTDECSFAGSVRAHLAARDCGLPLIHGTELRLADDGIRLVLLATDRASYGRLAALVTAGRRAAEKGGYRLTRADLDAADLAGCLALYAPIDPFSPAAADDARWVAGRFGASAWLAVELHREARDAERLTRLLDLARQTGLRPVAAGDVHMHRRARRALQDVLTALRLHTTVQQAGRALFANAERRLRTRGELAAIYPPELLAETLAIAERCAFSFDELRYEYPRELVPAGSTPSRHLRELSLAGAARRWPGGVLPQVRAQIERELVLIAELRYEPFFLTVHDIVHYARGRGILCQGRGSAANSAVCFCLGITEVDPARGHLLFERFISKERNEPPDIDVDFEHERREEVIQYIYGKYGRARAALAATVISYRARSAIRDVARALGFGPDQIVQLGANRAWWDREALAADRLREQGFDPDNPLIARLRWLVDELIGFPRHLSQHVGGFVISEGPLCELVPIENAAMPGRTVIQWDKDDLDALGLLKVDCLGLGMLSVIRRAFDLIQQHRGRALTLASVPPEDPAVYAMLQQADSIGVFQVESRAQMTMLPRLKPECFYDLVIEVAILRPGPIQGEMVHPYLRRRRGEEPVDYPNAAVRAVLERTLGVPIFQEQVIELAQVAAGFTAGEADQLRRSMAAWKRNGGLEHFRQRLLDGMHARGFSDEYAERIYRQLLGFGAYGFPESHAASFALLVYVSAWLKCHEPAAFAAALINSQPMGFYAPAQLIIDARRHGVEVRPIDVTRSEYDCTLEPCKGPGGLALRLGLRLVLGLAEAAAERIVTARIRKPFASVTELARRAGLDRGALERLAAADALHALAGNRHQARWQTRGVEPARAMFENAEPPEGVPMLRTPREGESILADYRHTHLSLRRHPLALLRKRLAAKGLRTAAEVGAFEHGEWASAAGIVTCRQRPGTATGVVFLTLEDETGYTNVVVWSRVVEQHRAVVLGARLVGVAGQVQRDGEVVHLIARRLEDLSALIGTLPSVSRDFH